MKKSMSRVLSLALVLVMVLGVMPLALAAGDAAVPADETALTLGVTVNPGKVAPNGEYTISITPPTDYEIVTVTKWPWAPKSTTATTATYDATSTPGSYPFDVIATVKKTGAEDGTTATATGSGSITVEAPVTDPAIQIKGASTLTLVDKTVSTTLNVETTALPEGYTLGEVSWSVNGTAAAGKEASFVLTADKEGEYKVHAEATFNGPEQATKTATADFTVTVSKAAYTVTLNKTSLTLAPKETASLTVSAVSADGTPVAAEKIKTVWNTKNSAVATVDQNGAVTAVAAGSTTITADVTIEGQTYHLEAAVTVSGAVIEVADGSTSYSSYTLTPVLKINGTPVDATFTFTVDNVLVGSDVKSVAVTGNNQVKTVTVRVASFKTADGQNATADVLNAVAPKTVRISFYNSNIDIKVSMLNGRNSFLFGEDKDIEGTSTVVAQMLAAIGNKDPFQHVVFNKTEDTYGKLTLPTSSSIDGSGKKWVILGKENKQALGDVRFTILNDSKGEWRTSFRLVDALEPNLIFGEGTITIKHGESAADIIYTTTSNKSFQLNERDFENYWTKSGQRGYPRFVIFGAQPHYGDLYDDSTMKSRTSDTDKFYFAGNTGRLNDVTYSPNSIINGYVDEVPFAMYGGTNDKDIVYGTMQIKVGSTMNFRDVNPGDWFYEHVQYAYDQGIMNGVSSTLFGPQNPLTRGMVVTMLYRIEGEPRTFRSGTFTDVASGTWYTDAVEWAAENNIVNGYGTTFGPNDNIKRQDLASILYRYAQYKKMNTYSASSLTRFSDYQRVASYATNAMEWAVYNKIMNGNDRNMLSPAGNATRAEAAKMFHVFLELK